MDETDPLEARTARLHALEDTDPVAWAICWGKRGLLTIADFLDMKPDDVQVELRRLLKTKAIKAKPWRNTRSYQPHSLEMKRLARRAWAIKREERE